MKRHLSARHFPRAAATLIFGGACMILFNPLSAQQPKPRATFDAYTLGVSSLAFSSDGKTLVSGGNDDSDVSILPSIKLWDLATGRTTTTLKSADLDSGGAVAISPDGKILVSWRDGGKINLWNVATGKCTNRLDQSSDHSNRILIFSPDGKTLASGGRCVACMFLWDVATGRSTATLEGYDLWGVEAMAFMPDGKIMASMGHNGVIKLWDVATGKNTATLKTAHGAEREDFRGLTAAAFSPDRKTVATGSDDNDKVKLWEVATGKQVSALKVHAAGVFRWSALAYSPDGKTLAADDEEGMSIQLWNVGTGKEQAALRETEGDVTCIAFSSDGKTLASGSEDKTIKLWDVSKLQPTTR